MYIFPLSYRALLLLWLFWCELLLDTGIKELRRDLKLFSLLCFMISLVVHRKSFNKDLRKYYPDWMFYFRLVHFLNQHLYQRQTLLAALEIAIWVWMRCDFMLQAFQLSEIRAVVVLICGCCPGGSLSNILALAIRGDMNLRYTHAHRHIHTHTHTHTLLILSCKLKT